MSSKVQRQRSQLFEAHREKDAAEARVAELEAALAEESQQLRDTSEALALANNTNSDLLKEIEEKDATIRKMKEVFGP